ncbi:hypothetical protein L1887_58256 [Cichorium endivia]|nr:hypothetical protein L1887_58256 [Cichorium endivia]
MEMHAVASTSHAAPEPRPSSRKKRPRRIYDVDGESPRLVGALAPSPLTPATSSDSLIGRSQHQGRRWLDAGNLMDAIVVQAGLWRSRASVCGPDQAVAVGRQPAAPGQHPIRTAHVHAATEEEDEEHGEVDAGENEQIHGDGEDEGSDEEDELDGIRSRTAAGNNGSDVTLAQLLSLQTQADAQGAEEAANADAAPTPPRRSALNLFGSIR